jgi:hypothetical protein
MASDREAKDGQLTTGFSGRHIAAAEPERYAAEPKRRFQSFHLKSGSSLLRANPRECS